MYQNNLIFYFRDDYVFFYIKFICNVIMRAIYLAIFTRLELMTLLSWFKVSKPHIKVKLYVKRMWLA